MADARNHEKRRDGMHETEEELRVSSDVSIVPPSRLVLCQDADKSPTLAAPSGTRQALAAGFPEASVEGGPGDTRGE